MPKPKSKKRVAEYGEVFTAQEQVKAMCDMVKQETDRIDSRFLEPACGEGAFLSEILKRKLTAVTRKYGRSPYDWERNSLLALGSIYGIELLTENVNACRSRLFNIWNNRYKRICKAECSEETRKSAQFILKLNIVCGNALTYQYVDQQRQDNGNPIIFSEWSFPFNDTKIQRKDYIFAKLFEKRKTRSDKNILNEIKPELLKQYISHYQQITTEENHRGL